MMGSECKRNVANMADGRHPVRHLAIRCPPFPRAVQATPLSSGKMLEDENWDLSVVSSDMLRGRVFANTRRLAASPIRLLAHPAIG